MAALCQTKLESLTMRGGQREWSWGGRVGQVQNIRVLFRSDKRNEDRGVFPCVSYQETLFTSVVLRNVRAEANKCDMTGRELVLPSSAYLQMTVSSGTVLWVHPP